MNLERFSTLYYLICLAFISGWARAKMDINMTKMECLNYVPALLKNLSCHLNQTSRGTGSLSFEFSLTEDLHDIKGHFLLSVKRGSSIMDYFSLDMDYCQLLVSQHSNYLIRSFTNDVRRHSNFPCQCPFKMNKPYYVSDARPDTRILPSYLPELSFISDMKINYKNKKALQVIVHGSLVRS